MSFALINRNHTLKAVLVILCLIACRHFVVAQNDFHTPLGLKPGTPAGSYAMGDIDTVNLFSGRVNVRIPLLNRSGRGQAGTQTSFLTDSPARWQIYKSYDLNGNPIYGPGPGSSSNPDAQMTAVGEHTVYPVGVGTGPTSFCSEGLYLWGGTLTRFYWVEPNGTEHEMRDVLTNGQVLPSGAGGCWTLGPYRGRVFVSTDGSGATFITDVAVRDGIYVNMEYPYGVDWDGWLLLKDGRKIRIQWTGTNARGMRDRNGNYLVSNNTLNNPNIFDSFNHPFGRGTASSSECNALVPGSNICTYSSYKGFGGAERRFYEFWDPNYSTSRIFLPNGQSFTLYWNEYYDLLRIDLPSGGSIEYDYGPGLAGSESGYQLEGGPPGVYVGGPNDMHIYRRLLERRVYREGHVLESRQTFSRPEDVELNNVGYVEKKEYDGSGVLLRSEKHYFYGGAERSFWLFPTQYSAWMDGLEYRTEIFDGNGNLLRKTERSWEQRAPVSWWTGSPETAPANDPRISQETNYFENGTFQIITYGYDPNLPYNSLTDKYERQFNTYAIVRHTKTDYLKVLNGVDYTGSNIQNGTSPHMRDFPVRISVYDGGGTERARTTYEYDNYASDTNHALLVNRSGIIGFDPTYSTSYLTRGNVTGVTRYLLTNGTVTGSVSTYNQYDIAGNVVKSIDGRGYATTIDYSDRFGSPGVEAQTNSAPSELGGQFTYAFATSVVNPFGHTSFTQYDYYLGQGVDVEDANGILSSAYFSDPLDRATQLISSNNPSSTLRTQTTFSYDDNGRTVTTTTDKDNFNDNLLKTQTVYDGLSRTVENRQFEDSTNYIAVKRVPYSILQDGGAWFVVTQVSNPYRPYLGEQPVWNTTFTDAIGRVVKVRTPDNATVTTVYSGRASTVTDQSGKKRKGVLDEFGNMAEVYEDPDGVNYQTSYAYDVLGNLVRVIQGSQTRYFMYDSLKRLIRVKNPEQNAYAPLTLTDPLTGNSSWSLGYEYDNNDNLTVRTDPRGVLTQNSFDAINRVRTVLFRVNGQPDPNTGDIEFLYDNAANGKGRPWLSYRWGAKPQQTAVGQYDTLGRVTQFYNLFGDGQGNWYPAYAINATYNRANGITSETYPSGHTVSYTYDNVGRTTSFAGNLGDGVSRTYANNITYSPFGNIAKEQFGTNTPLYHKRFYNIRGQLFDTRLSSVNDTWDWNRGRLILYYSSNHLWGQSGTDNNGNVRHSETWLPPENATLDQADTLIEDNYTYDSLDRLSSVAEQRMSVAAGWGNWQQQFRQQYVYDRYGNRTIDAAQTWGIGINNKQFTVDTSTNRLGVPSGQSGSMIYDNAGNLLNDTYSGSGARIYDANSFMIQATDFTGQQSSYTYDADGRRVRRKVSGSDETWQVYGLNGELLAEYAAGASPSNPQKEYGYRSGQLLVTATGRTNVALAANGAVATASTAHTCCGFSTTGAINGNKRGPWGNGEGWNDATPDSLPDWIQVDFAGNKTIDEISVFSLHDNYTVENTPPTETQTFTLYGLLAFQVQYWNGSSWVTVPGGNITGNNKVWRKITFSPITTTKIRVYITSVPDSWSRVVEIEAYGTSSGDTVQWLVSDYLGTPRMVVGQAGSLSSVKRHDYLPYGEELYAGVGGRTTQLGYNADNVRQKFTGYEADWETGLNYAQARYQSSIQGRFTTTDPVSGIAADPQTWNMYSYTGNNPVNRTDPTGQSYFMGSGANDPYISEYRDTVYYPRGTLSDEVGSALSAHNQRLQNTRDVIAANKAAAEGNLDKFFEIVNKNDNLEVEVSGTVTVSAEILAPDEVKILTPEGPFVAPETALDNRKKRGDGDCAQMPQYDLEKLGIGRTENWIAGPAVYRNYALRRGTVIATFVNGRYPNKEHGNHVAYFLYHTDDGFVVLEQVRGTIQLRAIDRIGGGYFWDPRAYSVVMKSKGNPNEIRLSNGAVLPPIK